MEFGSSGRDGPGFSSSSPSSSSSSPQYKTGSIIGGIGAGHAGALSSAIYDGPDTKLELMNSSSPKNDDASAAAEGQRSSAPAASVVEKEHMFDKVVTPSDVGKLNRLVIPKQHAEKYFPLDSSTNEKGLLLNFEDRNGKPWRFRYSYWNSSQSYVMTKGWSRFVKEKKLDAGDVVSFQRGVGELSKDRLFIDWRRRPDAPDQYHHHSHHGHHHHHHLGHAAASMYHHGSHIPAAAAAFSYGGRPVPWSHALMRPPPPRDGAAHMQYLSPSAAMSYGAIGLHHSVPYRNSYGGGGGGGEGGAGGGTGSTSYAFGGHVPSTGGPVFYLRSPAAGTPQLELEQQQQQQAAQVAVHRGGGEAMVFDSVPVAHGKAAEAAGGKRLRLFGVNMECPTSEGHEECELLSSTTTISSSSSSINNASQAHHPLQLRLYNGTPIAGISTVDYLNKGKASMTLNFDI